MSAPRVFTCPECGETRDLGRDIRHRIGCSRGWPTDAPPASAPRPDGRTHYEGCWTEHHDCARARIQELERTVGSRDVDLAELRYRMEQRDAEIARLREALEEITEQSSYSIDYRYAFHDALSRAGRALSGAAPKTETPRG